MYLVFEHTYFSQNASFLIIIIPKMMIQNRTMAMVIEAKIIIVRLDFDFPVK